MADAKYPAGAENGDSPRGFAFALAAYLLWGFLPFFMKAVGHIPATEVVAHRIVWSVPLAGLVLVVLGRTADIRAALASPRTPLLTASRADAQTDAQRPRGLGHRGRLAHRALQTKVHLGAPLR